MNLRPLKRLLLLLQHPNRLAARRRSFPQLLRRFRSNRRNFVPDRRRRSASGKRSSLVLKKRKG
jgi:hypothetical protein